MESTLTLEELKNLEIQRQEQVHNLESKLADVQSKTAKVVSTDEIHKAEAVRWPGTTPWSRLFNTTYLIQQSFFLSEFEGCRRCLGCTEENVLQNLGNGVGKHGWQPGMKGALTITIQAYVLAAHA